ncbi:hypothetical protein ACFXPA_46550 [Amycolatopsis sp. NPDC059090]|uniref:hypothetical protein n=1 Tax=Amycolatopsis sp. NPDC059090 TaxID=3346723 RepID=UPI00366B7DD9
MRKRAEHLVSGDQIVRADGRRDRVHGVDRDREPGAVFVTTDSARSVRYDRAAVVTVV